MEKSTNKAVSIIVVICLLIAAILVIIMCCRPKDYEYKITQFEVMEWLRMAKRHLLPRPKPPTYIKFLFNLL